MLQRITKLMISLTMILTMITVNANESPTVIFDNGKLRFGNGSAASINSSGNLLQPWYYNPNFIPESSQSKTSDDYYKLTYSQNPLDFEIGVGGNGQDYWNRNGIFLLNPSLTNPDTSETASPKIEFIDYNATGKFGTVQVSGIVNFIDNNVTIASIKIETTYELGQMASYIKVSTKFTNVGMSKIENFRYWVGTRDDWIGQTDRPTKTKGNLLNGEFIPIEIQSTTSKALKIYTGNDGVLFYTDSDKANIIVGAGFGWSYIQNRNPIDSPITSNSDQSYAFYVRFNDLEVNESDDIVWYYAAGPLAELDSIIESVASAVAAINDIDYDNAKLGITSNVAGTGYVMVVLKDSTAPTAQQIAAGVDYNNVNVVFSTSAAISVNTPIDFELLNLIDGTAYDVYFVFTADNGATYEAISKYQFTSKAYEITYQTNGGTSLPNLGLTRGSSFQLPIPTKTGYNFLGWYTDQALTTLFSVDSSGNSIFPNQDTTLYAKWEPIVYTINYQLYGGTAVNNPTTFTIESSLTINNPARLGSTFLGWYLDANFQTPLVINNQNQATIPLANTTLYAKWDQQGYTITYQLNGGSNHPDNPPLYTITTPTITLNPPKLIGYTFVGWLDEQGNRITSIVAGSTGNRVLTAQYMVNNYAVNFNSRGGTPVASIVLPYLSEFELPADPIRPGYIFDGWYWDTSFFSKYQYPLIQSFDVTVYAKWNVAKQVTILEQPVAAMTTSAASVRLLGLVDAVEIGDLEGIETVVIELEANDEVLPTVKRLAAISLSNNNFELLKSYDIAIFKTVTPVNGEPNRSRIANEDLLNKVKVYIPVPKGVDPQLVKAVFIDADGEIEILDSWIEVEDDQVYVVFETDHFSYYGLVIQQSASETTTPLTSTIPKTDGSNPWTGIWLGLAMLMGLIELVIRLKRKYFTL